jgi:glycosyltransferase involved in cell wall biosynthesis
MNISVVIPTYKRPTTLLQTLRSLQEQTVTDFEILVMDNAAEPSVEQAVTEFNRTAKVPVRYTPEPRLGVHYARNRAAQIAGGELLLYTDDDMSFAPHWVKAYREAFAKHPEMVAASGPVRPIWEQEPPLWLLEYMGTPKMFTILSLMEPHETFQLSKDGWFFSCNMALWKRALVELGGFHPENTAGKWVGDGETGLNHKMFARGDLIGYVPTALSYHHIPPARMTVEYFCHRMANEGAAELYTEYNKNLPSRWQMLRTSIWFARHYRKAHAAAQRVRGNTDRESLNLQMRAARLQSKMNYAFRLVWDGKFRQMVGQKSWLERE